MPTAFVVSERVPSFRNEFLADAQALGDATEALGEVLETASLERWNDDPARSRDEVLGAFDRLLRQLEDS